MPFNFDLIRTVCGRNAVWQFKLRSPVRTERLQGKPGIYIMQNTMVGGGGGWMATWK